MKFHYTSTGKGIQDTENIKRRTEQKFRRLERLLPDNADIYVTYSVVRQENNIEVSIPLSKRILRAQVAGDTMYTAIDEVIDVLEKQMVKYKSRLRDRSRRDSNFSEEWQLMGSDESEAPDSQVIINKVKHFPLKPMDAEEAVMEMELLGHSFYVFRNGHTDDVNVVYKRHDGTCGLIEPE